MSSFFTGGAALPSKFPFWSAIITQTYGNVPVGVSSSVTVDIQPPAGETWLIWLDSWINANAAGSKVVYVQYDGSHTYVVTYVETGGTYGDRIPHYGVLKVLTNSLYAQLSFTNTSAAGVSGCYGYSGFKLSQPLWAPKPLKSLAQPFKKPTAQSLPSPLAPLQKYAAEILGLDPAKPNEYALGIILEEDTPLAVDEKTGFPVERLTAVVKADVLADFIAKFKAKTADPVATGYRKYLDKWKAEGIDFGV